MEVVYRWFAKVYTFVFDYPPSEFSSELFRYFIMAAGSTGIATVLTFGINILGARYMGPAEFGKWNLIGSWAEFLIIVPLFGLTTALPRYLGAATEDESKKIYVGSAFRIMLISSAIILPILWLVQKQFRIIPDASIAGATFVYAIILAFFYFLQSVFQGLKQFKRLSILWIVSAFGFVGTVLIYLFVLHNNSYQSLYLGNVIRLAFMVVAGFFVFGPLFLRSGRGERRELLHFGSFSMLTVVAGFFSLGSIDNIMINRYLGSGAVGLYAAYMVVFSVFINRIINTFSQVFLPSAAGHKQPKALLNNWIRFYGKFLPLIIGGLDVLIWLIFRFYGRGFQFDPKLALLIAISNALYGFLAVVGSILISIGIKGARIGVIFAFTSAAINVGLDMLLIPRLQLYGSVFATLIATVTIIIWSVGYIRRMDYVG